MKQVTAIIHLVKRGRTTTARYGQFLRPDKAPHPCATDLHLWLGRELSIQEFNEMLPKAIRSVLSTDTVYAQIIEREVPGDEPDAADLEAVKAEHAAQIAMIQAGLDEFTAEHNKNLEDARARILELESALPSVGEATKPEAVAVEPASDTNSLENAPPSEVGNSLVVEAAPSAAGEQSADAAATISDKPKAKAKDKPKAK